MLETNKKQVPQNYSENIDPSYVNQIFRDRKSNKSVTEIKWPE